MLRTLVSYRRDALPVVIDVAHAIFPFFFFGTWFGVFCCVLVRGMLVFPLIKLNELRLFGLHCFTVL